MNTAAQEARALNPLGACLLGLLLTAPLAAQTFYPQVTHTLQLDPCCFVGYFVAVGDYDNDGLPDLVLSGNPRLVGGTDVVPLLHNRGGGQFEVETGILDGETAVRLRGYGAAFADYDNDGDLDLFQPVGHVFRPAPNMLLRNDRGQFKNVRESAQLHDTLPTDNALWLDHDRDGDLDLYVGHWRFDVADSEKGVTADPPLRNKLYRNDGDGSFTDVTDVVGLDVGLRKDMGSANGMVAADFDDDGWPDLYLGVWKGPNRLFLGDGQGRFRDATHGDIGESGKANGVAVGDVDNDGDLDLFQASGGRLSGDDPLPWHSFLLLNQGGGRFVDVTASAGLGRLSTLEIDGVHLVDIDNDGDLDLATGRPMLLFLNDGAGRFVDGTDQLGIRGHEPSLDRFLDFDVDGFLDAVATVDPLSDTPSVSFYRNRENENSWLRVELVGTNSNRNGIGARLVATAGSLRQVRQILGGTGLGQEEYVAHFGLGPHTRVDSLHIHWPSGHEDLHLDISVNQSLRVFEATPLYHPTQPFEWSLTDTVVVGSTAHLSATVLPDLFEPDANIVNVAADLRSFGGPSGLKLVEAANETFVLDQQRISVEGANGRRRVVVMVDQQTAHGLHWTRLVRSVVVLPDRDEAIFTDGPTEDWEVQPVDGDFDVTATHQADDGDASLEIMATRSRAGPSTIPWRVDLARQRPIDQVGYKSLRFVVEPRDEPQTASSLASVFTVRADARSRFDLLKNDQGIHVDLGRREWQEVEIPLDLLAPEEGPIQSIRLSGNFAGTIYLRDIRLTAVSVAPTTVVVETALDATPTTFALSQNYPNPFNPNTTIRFDLPQSADVDLTVYNMAGQRIAELVSGLRQAGNYSVRWDGKDDAGRDLASGMYLYRLIAGDHVETRKLMLLR